MSRVRKKREEALRAEGALFQIKKSDMPEDMQKFGGTVLKQAFQEFKVEETKVLNLGVGKKDIESI